jgi:hypothetical protein
MKSTANGNAWSTQNEQGLRKIRIKLRVEMKSINDLWRH